MIIGIPKEIKRHEYRISLTPAGAAELVRSGHTVLVEGGAGTGSGFDDGAYLEAGAKICGREELFERSALIVKVKEPLPEEFPLFRHEQVLFTYLHLAPNVPLLQFFLEKEIIAIGYETLEKDGTLPLLTPMSEVAGRMAPLVGAFYLHKSDGGTGVLPCGVPGVKPARALILGAGVVGANATRICTGLGMDTTVLNRSVERLQTLEELYAGRLKTLVLNARVLEEEIRSADLVIGAVLVPGGRTPLLISREMLRTMKRGAVLVDVSIDQGGCAATSHPTTHDDPIYSEEGVIHYTVANMPGAYPWTSTLALTNATLPYIWKLAQMGIDEALKADAALAGAVNTRAGAIIHPVLAAAMQR
ncbi:alanine dehydrogenase [Geotalea sp. SG265]|uniref:alanine dehydrogenase n=1 Tax=Geotalea sp. SG265 TaxID=2922867 RepID=UPI001FB02909|nr:alanine dehydrogenase [Geotalea sp. SG265]